VVANLYAEVICDLAEDLARVTGKHLVLAGILSDRWESVLEALSPPLTLESKTDDGEWVSLHLVRP
jgi:ribosomal protein L11 methylase PrmA